ncbi:outer membrane beta-barrel protein [Congregicoccus parvus]|uniref:outer membrane beta-barrel protein n=1 Tax=Congregicoccus parvus TaxID=3081749 RepID=UPI003FA5FC1D
MNHPKNDCMRGVFRLFALLFIIVGFAGVIRAQEATGTITGRVFDPATREYLRNVEIRVEGTSLATISQQGGRFRLPNVPAGSFIVVARFPGYPDLRTSVVVTAGTDSNVMLEFGAASSTDDTIVLSEFEVSSEIAGNAKALAEQRNSMDLGRLVASDTFGDVTEGNVGEFLKYMPGIELEYVEADTRGPRLGGMNPEYTGVAVDGMRQASADGFIQYGATENGSSGGGGRSFGFEQISINSIESIEISRVTPANLDADAPAGTINLRTRRAFDRDGRSIRWSLSGGLNSEEFHLKRTPGPDDDGESHKIRPTMSFSFADTFLDKRLGILLGYSNSNLYNEQYRVEHAYSRVPTAANPQVLTRIRLKDGPKWTNRRSYTGTFDFKVSEDLVLSLTTVFNDYHANFYNRNVDFEPANNATRNTVGGDGITNVIVTDAGDPRRRRVNLGGGNGNKTTESYTISPKIEWRLGNLLVEARASRSNSLNEYGNLRRGAVQFAPTNPIEGVEFTAVRSDPLAADWQIVQTGGPDWSNLANFRNPRLQDDYREILNRIDIAALDFTYNLETKFPFVIRAGGKFREETTNTDQESGLFRWNYIGPGGGPTGSWADFPSDFVHDLKPFGSTYTSISGNNFVPFPNTELLGDYFLRNPAFFVNSTSANDYFNANFGDRRRFTEDVAAGYLMANTQLGNLTLQGGLRWEGTKTNSLEFDPLTRAEVEAAGFAWDTTNNRAATIEGLDYQFRTKPMVNRRGDYDRVFPTLSAKYRFTENLIADIGVGRTIRRPEVTRLVGIININDENETISIANPGLLPEYAERVAGSVSYYFGGTNNLTLTLTDTKIENLFVSDELTAEEFGLEDPLLAGYIVRTTRNSDAAVRFRSMELSYRHMLDFLPGPLQGTSVFVNYTRTYASERRPGITPHLVSTGFDWRYRWIGFGLKAVWVDDAPWTNTAGRIREGNVKFDGNLDIRLSRRLTAFVQARNITNEDHVVYEALDGYEPVLWRRENYGANYVFGLRGSF